MHFCWGLFSLADESTFGAFCLVFGHLMGFGDAKKYKVLPAFPPV